MLTVIIGGSGSGKSEFAESYVRALEEATVYYVATMLPYGEEGRRRIERHRKLREGKGFTTVECFRNVGSLSFPKRGAVLLECLTNLAANELFDGDVQREAKWYTEKLLEELEKLERACSHLVVVTGELFSDGIRYEAETGCYLQVLAQVHQKLCERACEVIEVVAGLPDYRKEMINDRSRKR